MTNALPVDDEAKRTDPKECLNRYRMESIVDSDLAKELANRIAGRWEGEPLVVGVCGAQGSGKSTLCSSIRRQLCEGGRSAVAISLDDFYLTRVERQILAAQIHPLLITRGVPGTHDVALIKKTLRDLCSKGSVSVPVFNKALDDRQPSHTWLTVEAPIDVILFEGWCVGAAPERETALKDPVNDLERCEDVGGYWRRYVNRALWSYQELFRAIEILIFLAAPTFDVVHQWRGQQERDLRTRAGDDPSNAGVMTDEDLRRFISHYERLTRHMLREMPARADVVVRMDQSRHGKVDGPNI